MYSGNYSAHIKNYGVLQNSFVLRESNFVPNKEKKSLPYCTKTTF
ncbi:hypothetical protein T03_8622 [Trichinella britovi]|uniref:Uncharacterized protein n=1 Tax=Trichinella britovi TaxID=45882 RepID=A0A0V0YVE3_TRIBR|nr:hypothetical protein T03_8622 [Trichinella britovi]